MGGDLGAREREALSRVPEGAWQVAIDHHGAVRERRTEDACPHPRCGHERCWVEQAHVTELTELLREGPAGDQLAGWPPSMRAFARRERPHPGAQLSVFETTDSWRHCPVGDQPAHQPARLAHPSASIDAAHRVQARVEDGIRTGKDCGIGHVPSHDFAINSAWLAAALIAATLLARLRLLAVDGELARAEPKTLRYKILHTAARLTHSGRRRRLKISKTWPWATVIATAWTRLNALPQAP